MPINRKIEEILDKRLGRGAYEGRGRLQKIKQRIESIRNVQNRINELDALINTISCQIEIQQGEYYNMLVKDPDALTNFKELERLYTITNGHRQLKALCKIEGLIEKLELLRQRFDREAIRIAFIGAERQGKSTFIKTITGLSDKVIPAYSGNSCTGAVSVIHNVDKVVDNNVVQDVKVVVEYYNANEFIEIVNEKLLRFFPDGSKRIGRLEQIKTLNLPEQVNLNAKLVAEYNKFKESVIKNYEEYIDLIGSGVQSYYDEDIIAHHVAQYEEFEEEVENSAKVNKEDGKVVYVLKYYKYVAVKNVNIYKDFLVNETKLLELVDSIGIGSAADTKAIEDEMYRILREDCDAAIDLFRPTAIPNYPQEQVDILNNIEQELADRDPSKWIVYILNKVNQGIFINTNSIDEVKNNIENVLKTMVQRPVAWVKEVDGNNFEEVKKLLVIPLLELIANNLESLDDNLVRQVDNDADDAYNDCLSLVKAANDVTSASAGLNADALALFDNLYSELLDSFGREMNNIDINGYAKNKDKECPELSNAYEDVIKGINKYVPKRDVILERFQTGALLTPIQLFEEYIEQMRNDIFSAFETVNIEVLYPLQEKVKNDLIAVLYNQGLMNHLPTPYNSPSKEWLQNVIDNYVDEKVYPNLFKALKFILDYQINIEGLVEYNVTKSLYIIDRTHRDFIIYKGKFQDNFDGQANEVWNELYNSIDQVKENLRKWISAFTLIPSHSFYSRVHKFYIKVLTDKGGVVEMRNFYRKNMGLIWTNEINAAGRAQKAFGDWTERTKNLREVVTSKNFKE